MNNILVVDDERDIVNLIELYLTNEGYNVYKCYSGLEALEILKNNSIDLAIIDLMMPEMDGFELCKRIRDNYVFPLIMLTAKNEDTDKIMGLNLGADDYITKPFNLLELAARVKTQLRRYVVYNASDVNKDEYDINGLVINNSTHKCSLYGKDINLTPIEFSILWYLCCNKGKVVSSEELFEAVWKEAFFDSNNTVMAHIARLREKLNEAPRNPKIIKTVWGVGYKVE